MPKKEKDTAVPDSSELDASVNPDVWSGGQLKALDIYDRKNLDRSDFEEHEAEKSAREASAAKSIMTRLSSYKDMIMNIRSRMGG